MSEPDLLDLLVVGSGVAGLTAAVRAAAADPTVRVGVVSKATLAESATQWAQGGVAAVLSRSEARGSGREDSIELHVSDTLAAGVGLCDAQAVRTVVEGGPRRVRELIGHGAVFDRTSGGQLELAREGGHSTARVVHAGGAATGSEVERALVEAVRRSAAHLWEGAFALDLIVEGNRCRGVELLDDSGARRAIRARHTLLATGGAGQMFAVTTNPEQSTGDGIAMALRSGVAVADVEFLQFHPTALHAPWRPRPLLSEALRGEGAVLRDAEGRRFVDELAPRDVVSRTMTTRMLEAGVDHLWLDATPVAELDRRFPTLVGPLRDLGLDPGSDWLPVAPAAHYLCGGVLTDLDGATSLPGLWAAGEVACSGVHGANRLASNSLLEGLVFASRAVDAVLVGSDGPAANGAIQPLLDGSPDRPDRIPLVRIDTAFERFPAPTANAADDRDRLQRCMTAGAGVVRSESSLAAVAAELRRLSDPGHGPDRSGSVSIAQAELVNLLTVGAALVAAAAQRGESRGSHVRSDHPLTMAGHLHRIVQ
jgi:L-aspartate oxidase